MTIARKINAAERTNQRESGNN